MKQLLIILFFLLPFFAFVQPVGYYNGTEGLTGQALDNELHNIIKNHRCLSYYFSKYILLEADADPIIPGNVILVYTGRSQDGLSYGTGSNDIQREHVWAKSHGSFNEVLPMFSDAHNLKPEDASVNNSRSNLDFDNGGFPHPEATQCNYDDDSWEPRSQVKGDVARIIFYMATRYNGDNDEIDLKVKDLVNNYPNPWHGKLSALLQWNEQDPPDDFERHRNEVIYSYQGNRNPFIDQPKFVGLIYGNAQLPSMSIGSLSINPQLPKADERVNVSCRIAPLSGNAIVKLQWGNFYSYLENDLPMNNSGDVFTATIPPQPAESNVYFSIHVTEGVGNNTYSTVYNYRVAGSFLEETTPIIEIQGTGDVSPLAEQNVTTTGIVTGNFNAGYFIQDGFGPRKAIYVYDPGRNPAIGDSIVITGLVSEYYEMTEISNLSAFNLINRNIELPPPYVIKASDIGEDYEAVLIRIENATCTYSQYWTNNDMWKVNDGTGTVNIHNSLVCEFSPYMNEAYTISGPLSYNYSEWKIELRYLADVMEPTAINDLEIGNKLTLYPNPAKDEINIPLSAPLKGNATLSIFDLLGNKKFEVSLKSNEATINVNISNIGLNPGIYLVSLKDEKTLSAGRLIISK